MTEIVRSASAGTMESSDVYVEIEPGQAGIELRLESVVKGQFGPAIEEVVREVLDQCGVENAKVSVRDRGALDCTQEHIVHSITDKEVRNIVDEMFLDDTVDFLEEAPANLVKKVLRNTDAETRALINRFLNYPENSAGSLMTIEFVKLRGGMTVDVAMKQIKRTGMDKETIYTCYVIDGQRKLIGVVPLRTLICAKDEELVQDLM